jgi:quercetin dioxygenase-like cupin family protein
VNSKNQLTATDSAEVVVPCIELDPTLVFFTSELGFRIEMITPADNPNTAIISGYGLRLCLRVGGSGKDVSLRLRSTTRSPQLLQAPNGTQIEIISATAQVVLPPLQEALVISEFASDASWTIGRAGMRYRDLVPSRLGGRVIASHIHIPNGGPVPDYVHYHRISFQMIYCKSGWVRVIYEDQGESFVMQAGDCVLQPPEIRHRVLESSDNLEVIEIGSPAEHETFAEHEIKLPTLTLRPDRDFSGQKFVRHIASESPWLPWRFSGFVSRNTGIDKATNGLASAETVRGEIGATIIDDKTSHELFFVFVLNGAVSLSTKKSTQKTVLTANSSVALPSNCDFKLEITSPNTELLVVSQP